MKFEYEYTIKLNNHKIMATIVADAFFTTYSYGKDIDGNRGDGRIEIDELTFSIIDAKSNNVAENLKKRYPDIYESIEINTYKKAIEVYEERVG